MGGFAKATKRQSRARVALIGPSGSGKTYTSLSIATALGKRVAVIDTERGSASKYADLFDFDVLELNNFDPRNYVKAIIDAGDFDVLVIDSLSHAWTGRGGALELKDEAAKRSRSNDSFGAWREVTPIHNQLVDAILDAPMHVIATMRSKTEYVVEQDDRGKNRVRKLGLAPVQRDGLEYEFDVVADLTLDLDFIVSKSRCPALTGQVINKAGAQVAQTLSSWLSDGEIDGGSAPAVEAAESREVEPASTSAVPPDLAAITTVKEFLHTARAALGSAGMARLIGEVCGSAPVTDEDVPALVEKMLSAQDESFAEHG